MASRRRGHVLRGLQAVSVPGGEWERRFPESSVVSWERSGLAPAGVGDHRDVPVKGGQPL